MRNAVKKHTEILLKHVDLVLRGRVGAVGEV